MWKTHACLIKAGTVTLYSLDKRFIHWFVHYVRKIQVTGLLEILLLAGLNKFQTENELGQSNF